MSNALINSLPVLETRLQFPRFGNWTADVVVDSATASRVGQGAAARLVLGGGALPFMGTVYRVDSYADTVTLRLVGGANGLWKHCKPRFYRGVQMRLPLGDVLSDAGEALASSSDAAALGTQLSFWTLVQQPAAMALSLLAGAGPAATVWRMLADGTVFAGVDAFAPSKLSEYELIDYLPQEGVQVIAAEVPDVSPGQSFGGRHVSAVEHLVDANGSRSRLWFE